MKKTSTGIAITLLASLGLQTAQAEVTFKTGDPSLAKFLLDVVPYPADNQPTAARVELGQKLFFDPRMSCDGNMFCATCHNPAMG